MTILYPRRPTAQRAYRDELINNEIPFGGRREFYLNEPEGVGFVFAIASFEPFDYRGFTSGGQWSTMRLAGFGYSDPYRAVDSFVSRTLSSRAIIRPTTSSTKCWAMADIIATVTHTATHTTTTSISAVSIITG